MVKIKDFLLAFKNLGGGTCPPVPYSTSAHGYKTDLKFIKLTTNSKKLILNSYFLNFSCFTN